MAQTVGDFLVQRLSEWGIHRLYGYPGDGISGIMGALDRADNTPRFIQARHEELAAFMACAHAKFTGELGVCLATSGPGAIHLLNGLYDAKMDHQPVVAIVGQAATTALGGSYQQEVDLPSLFKDVAGEYVVTVASAPGIRHCIDRAIRTALDQRSVTCVIVPKDTQEETYRDPPEEHDTVHSGVGYYLPRVLPRDEDLHRAAEVLNSGQRVAMLVGQGAFGAIDELLAVADTLGAGVAKAWLGMAVVPDDVPFCTGGIGLLGTKPTLTLMKECDTLLMVGTSFPYCEFLPYEGQARGVQIDIDGRNLAIRYPVEVPLKGDAKLTLAALLPLLEQKEDRSWQDKIIAEMRQWRETLDPQAHGSANPINPQLPFWEISRRLPDDCILTADSGTAAVWYARHIVFKRGMMASGSGNLATMGPAVPYAIAAKFCHPDRLAVAFTGDGAMQMNGINGLVTIAKCWREWSDPRLVVLVLNNRDLNMVTWEQRVLSGNTRFVASQELPDFPYARFAESIGLQGVRVDEPEGVADACERALSADRPCVLEAVVDANVPILPPHITLKQAKMFAESLLKGDPNRAGVIAQSIKGMMDLLLPVGR